MNNLVSDFKTRFSEAMNVQGLRQVDIVEKTGIPKAAINHYLSGYAKPRQDKLYILSKALNVSEAWLMGYDVSPERHEEQNEMLLSAFEKTAAQFGMLKEDELKVLEAYRKANNQQKSLIMSLIDNLNL